jgi:hypothetical protein
MRLARPFYQLPVRFDVMRLQAEVLGLPAEAWVPHPSRIPGNAAVRLITPGGTETDALHGCMRPTRWLDAMPYVRQVLADFGVVWSRSRLMRLDGGASVPEHVDVDRHWHTRVRVHIPVVTWPQVRFHCGGETVHMAAGEAWIFDNWRPHRVDNRAEGARIHLVADTTGSADFWRRACGPPPPPEAWRTVGWNAAAQRELLTECAPRGSVMPAAEVALLVADLREELTAGEGAESRIPQFDALLDGLALDWRQLCARFGEDGDGLEVFLSLVQSVREAAQRLGQGLVLRTNQVTAASALERLVLQHLVADPAPRPVA